MTMLGTHMMREMNEGAAVFAKAAVQTVDPLEKPAAIYTFARGSSDAVANILSYEFMDRLGIPVTSLPPSVFSLGAGVEMSNALALVISQSGASDDLVACTKGVERSVAITNVRGSAVEASAGLTIPVNAGVENAVPATKTVLGSIGAGMALLTALDPSYRETSEKASKALGSLTSPLPESAKVVTALKAAEHVYVIGRKSSFGAAQEVALKLKETCALHAEAYSASEVLHGPLQLVSRPLTVLILDNGDDASRPSLDAAEHRFSEKAATVFRVSPANAGLPDLEPVAQAAALLHLLYPVIHSLALALGLDPDAPDTLQKVTSTR